MEENEENISEVKEQTGPSRGFVPREGDERASPSQGPQHVFPRWQCPVCGTMVYASNRKRHMGTKKHRDALYVLTERFEMT